jgi:hypothetical protein
MIPRQLSVQAVRTLEIQHIPMNDTFVQGWSRWSLVSSCRCRPGDFFGDAFAQQQTRAERGLCREPWEGDLRWESQ